MKHSELGGFYMYAYIFVRVKYTHMCNIYCELHDERNRPKIM